MTFSGAANQGDDSGRIIDRMLTEFSHPGSGGRLATRVGGCQLIDVTDVGYYPTLCPHQKALLLFLLLCLKDRATELRFEPQDTVTGVPWIRVSYVVNGEVYELVPPPAETAIDIIEDIKAFAGMTAIWRRILCVCPAVAGRIMSRFAAPTYGGFRIGAGGQVSEVMVMAQRSTRGDRILMQISVVDPVVARIADANLRRLFADRRDAVHVEATDGPIPA